MSAEIKVDQEYDLQSELDRKVLDALCVLSNRFTTGQITQFQTSEGMQTLYRAVYGLVKDKALEVAMDTYEPEIEGFNGYFAVLSRGDEKLFVTWRVDNESITIYESVTCDQREIKIPLAESPHTHFKRVIAALNKKGWFE